MKLYNSPIIDVGNVSQLIQNGENHTLSKNNIKKTNDYEVNIKVSEFDESGDSPPLMQGWMEEGSENSENIMNVSYTDMGFSNYYTKMEQEITKGSEDQDNPELILNELRAKNADRLIIASLNINFIYQKFEALKSLVHDKIDVLMISETKLDDSFPLQQKLSWWGHHYLCSTGPVL